MKFIIPNPVRLTNKRTITTKSDTQMIIVQIVNTVTYETLSTRLELAEGQNALDVVEGQNYTAVLLYDGNWGSVTLTATKG